MTEQVAEKPRSLIDQELDSAEREEGADKASLLATFAHEHFVNEGVAMSDTDFESGVVRKNVFVNGDDGEVFLQPGVPMEENNENIYSIRSYPKGINREISNFYTNTGERALVRVPQCKILKAPTKDNPYMFASLSDCSVITAKLGDEIWFAHLGMTERGAVEETVQFLQENGAEIGDIHVVLSKNEYPHGVDNGEYDSRKAKLEDLIALGLDQENIKSFEYVSREGKGNDNLMAVMVNSEGILTYRFDEGSGPQDADFTSF